MSHFRHRYILFGGMCQRHVVLEPISVWGKGCVNPPNGQLGIHNFLLRVWSQIPSMTIAKTWESQTTKKQDVLQIHYV